MFASLLRPKGKSAHLDETFLSSPNTALASSPSPLSPRRVRVHEPLPIPSELAESDQDYEDYHDDDGDVDHDDESHDGGDTEESAPLLPIFSTPHLDSLPVYHLTHDLRLLIASRCETTLTWEQLRSPQVSQFLLKPIQQVIHSSHFSRATLYGLMANCLQFRKEVDLKPGMSGASRTRAMVCELLAIKLLKEYSVRELIDALSYDFHPLQGESPPSSGTTLRGPGWDYRNQHLLKGVRISCLEIAIRAQAKRFLAHPLVVQHLEAIWAGIIVFHSAADNLHRQPVRSAASHFRGYGSIYTRNSNRKPIQNPGINDPILRRSVSLYNPRDASLFKLSRLRVPRYRQVLSTLSFAILLGLFLTVISKRSPDLTMLEVVFWFWSAGFLLDELVGFNEQGFSLYLMSFWNTFDVGILLLLFCYYCLRLYSVVISGPGKQEVVSLAYDVLAANAVLLLPRLFSVLDHSRYFSQLLIAFRMMAADLIAVLILIIIACSGFFVAFTLSFGNRDSPTDIAYALFQMVMGFTPAAWQLWDRYNALGKAILTLFLFICHFLVVTILITVLTNSFMAIVHNANEEHQFVFAVNTISMVKSDALFSYVAPSNIIAWAIAPLRYVMPFRGFIRLNRTIIKATHAPILFSIYLYERTILRAAVFEPTDLVEGRSRVGQFKAWAENHDPFTPAGNHRVREPSIATHQKDEALEEVFRRPFGSSAKRIPRFRGESSTAVNNWMQNFGPDGVAASPEEQDRRIVERLEGRRFFRPRFRRIHRDLGGSARDFTESTHSVASDPEDFLSHSIRRPIFPMPKDETISLPLQTDVDGDDELSSGENHEDDDSIDGGASTIKSGSVQKRDSSSSVLKNWDSLYSPKTSSRPSTARLLSRRNSPTRGQATPPRRHVRNLSSATILFNPVQLENKDPHAGNIKTSKVTVKTPGPQAKSGTTTPNRSGPRTPKHQSPGNTRSRQIPKSQPMSVPDLAGVLSSRLPSHRRHPSMTMGLGSDLGDNMAIGGGFVGGIPASFASQMAYAPRGLGRPGNTGDSRDMMSKLVLARMQNMERGFQEVLKEVKVLRRERTDPLRTGHAAGRFDGRRNSARGNTAAPMAVGRDRAESRSEDAGYLSDSAMEDDSSELRASSV